jgi:hypothetical protein
MFLAAMFRKLWEREYIKRKSEEVCSPAYARQFMEYLKLRRCTDEPILEFSDLQVCDFIAGRKHWFKVAVESMGFQIFRPETVNRLKDIFLHNLLNKKLVTVSRADKMQHVFSISSSQPSYKVYHDYMLEREKEKTTSAPQPHS